METVIALALTLLVLGFVGYPLLRERRPERTEIDDEGTLQVDRLLDRKDTAITAIKELEFDYAVGNLSDEDYEELKEKYERRAISILKTLDDTQSNAGKEERGANKSRRKGPSFVRENEEESTDEKLACLVCGKLNSPEHRFCTSCGAELNLAEEHQDSDSTLKTQIETPVLSKTGTTGNQVRRQRSVKSAHPNNGKEATR